MTASARPDPLSPFRHPLPDGRDWTAAARKEHARITLRIETLKADVQLEIDTIRHWNATHPDEPPFDDSYYRATLAWLTGDGPRPPLPADLPARLSTPPVAL